MSDLKGDLSTTIASFNSGESILMEKRDVFNDIQRMLMMNVFNRDTSRPKFRARLIHRLKRNGWIDAKKYLPDSPLAYSILEKERVGLKIQFGHSSTLGLDLLRFQSLSDSIDGIIDVGVYLVPTEAFISTMKMHHNKKWIDSVSFEKCVAILSKIQNSITLPMYIIGIELNDHDYSQIRR